MIRFFSAIVALGEPPRRRGRHIAVGRSVDEAGQLDLAAIGRDPDRLVVEPRTVERDVDVGADIGGVGQGFDGHCQTNVACYALHAC